MLVLRGSLTSPFVRKIRVASIVLSLMDQIRLDPTDTFDPTDSVRKQNPLGKIPTLILEDGTTLFDSRVILEYFDHLAGGGRIIPTQPKERFEALRLQALVDGILDAAVLRVQEDRFRSVDRHEPKWIEHQSDKMIRALAILENTPPKVTATPNVGDIGLASTLDWLDLRFDSICSKNYPKLMEWLNEFAIRVPRFTETKPQ